MKLLSLFLLLVSFNSQASLYCALGQKTPSEHISSLPYATVQIDALQTNQIQAYLTDYYGETDSNTIFNLSEKSNLQINNFETGTYLDEKSHATAQLKYQSGKIIFVMNKKSYTCEIL